MDESSASFLMGVFAGIILGCALTWGYVKDTREIKYIVIDKTQVEYHERP